MKKLILTIWSLIFITSSVFAQQKKTIQVMFELQEPSYTSFYVDSEIVRIKAQCASKIANLLNKEYAFFHFTTGDANKKLIIFLTSKDKLSSSKIHETGFKLQIVDATQGDLLYFTFRPIESYNKLLPTSVDLFIDEITSTFNAQLAKNSREMVSSVLSRYEVSEDYFILVLKTNGSIKRYYIAPLNENEFRIAKNSELRIVTTLGSVIFENTDGIVDAKVISCIKNIQAARTKYNLPPTYPERSLLMEITDTVSKPAGMIDTISKKVYLLNYLPLINSEMELSVPDGVSNNPN